ncbi:MAG: hypothetical protein Q8K75_05680 [Chlamydiales bacterium]|nr:hypothetical protein [Chlamydiales bacterium]
MHTEELQDYPHEKLAEQISRAKSHAVMVKVECIRAIDLVIDHLTRAIKSIQATPAVKGLWARIKAGFSNRSKIRRLHKEIKRLEKAKVRVEKSLINSYSDAENLSEEVSEEIDHLLSCRGDLPSLPLDARDLTRPIQASRREFRESIRQCTHDVDKELDRLRDYLDDKSKKSEIKSLMDEVTFTDYKKLSDLDSLNNKARFIVIPALIIPEVAEEEIHAEEPMATGTSNYAEEGPQEPSVFVESEPEPAYSPSEAIAESENIAVDTQEETEQEVEEEYYADQPLVEPSIVVEEPLAETIVAEDPEPEYEPEPPPPSYTPKEETVDVDERYKPPQIFASHGVEEVTELPMVAAEPTEQAALVMDEEEEEVTLPSKFDEEDEDEESSFADEEVETEASLAEGEPDTYKPPSDLSSYHVDEEELEEEDDAFAAANLVKVEENLPALPLEDDDLFHLDVNEEENSDLLDEEDEEDDKHNEKTA